MKGRWAERLPVLASVADRALRNQRPGVLPYRYVARGLVRRRTSTLLTLISFAMVCLVWMVLHSMIGTMRETLERSGSPRRMVVMSRHAAAENQSRLEWGQIRWVRAHPAVEVAPNGLPRVSTDVSAATLVRVLRPGTEGKRTESGGIGGGGIGGGGIGGRGAGEMVVETSGAGIQVNVRGVRMSDAALAHSGFTLNQGRHPRPGEAECIVGSSLANSQGIRPGDCMEIWRSSWLVTGVYDIPGSPLESEIWTTKESLASIAGKTSATSLWAVLESQSDADLFAAELEERHGSSMKALSETAYFGKGARAASQLQLLVYAVSVILAFGAMLSSLNTLYASLSAREGEFAAMRAIGFAPRSIRMSVRIEALTIAWAGGMAAAVFAWPMSGIRFRTMVSGIGFVVFTLDVDPWVIVSGMAFATFMGLAGGALPAIASTRQPITDALQKAMAVALLFTCLPADGSAQTIGHHGFETGIRMEDPPRLIQAAWDHHPETRRLATSLKIAEMDHRTERLGAFPDFRVQSRYEQLSESPRYPRFDPEGGLAFVGQGRPNRFLMQAELAHDLRNAAVSRRRAEAVSLQHDQLEIRLERIQRELWIRTEGHLHAIRHTIRLLEGADRMVEWQSEAVAMDESALTSGSLTYDRVEAGRSSLLERRHERSDLAASLEAELAELSLLTGWDPDTLLMEAENWNPVDGDWCLPEHAPNGSELDQALRTHPQSRELLLEARRLQTAARSQRLESGPEWTLSARASYSGPKSLFGIDLPGVREWTGDLGVRIEWSWKKHRVSHFQAKRTEWRSLEAKMEVEAWRDGFVDQWHARIREWDVSCSALLAGHSELERMVAEEQRVRHRVESGASSPRDVLDRSLSRMRAWMETERIRLELSRTRMAWALLTLQPETPWISEERE